MKFWGGVVALMLAIFSACTSPNPRDCSDGSCTDPAFPFCDVDGLIGGTPNICVPGACGANEVQGCRGNTEVVCNADGTNYELKNCSGMCDPALGCIECTADAECSAAEPHCDATTHACRGCVADAECASGACSTTAGTCIDPSTLIYAAPTGSNAAACGTQQLPCDLATAVAHADPTKNTIKLQTGDYTVATLDLVGTKVVTILGSGSMLRAGLNPLFFVRDSARLALQNASVFSAINCVSTTAAIPELKLDSVSFLQGKGIVARPCTVVATRTSFSVDPPMGGTALFVSLPAMPATGTSKVIFDRVSIRNMGLSVSGTGDVLNMVNSVVDGSEASFGAAMTFEMSAGGTFLFSTFVNAPMSCGSSASITVSNSIMFGTMANDVLYEISAVCPVHYTLMNPQAAVYTGWDHVLRNVDPLLTSLPNHDFHLPATSPAVDAADPAAVLSTDIEGTARPQGTRLDLGAFEYKKP